MVITGSWDKTVRVQCYCLYCSAMLKWTTRTRSKDTLIHTFWNVNILIKSIILCNLFYLFCCLCCRWRFGIVELLLQLPPCNLTKGYMPWIVVTQYWWLVQQTNKCTSSICNVRTSELTRAVYLYIFVFLFWWCNPSAFVCEQLDLIKLQNINHQWRTKLDVYLFLITS